MTTLTDLTLAQIKPHPKNVRRDAAADVELVDSVKAQGILQPLGVVASGKSYLLIAGHRRYAAAKAAKLKKVPVIVLEHLETEADQIEAMLVENGRRTDLTAVEEAAAYEQLTLLGVEISEIAKKTGRSAKTITSRLDLIRLPDAAAAALHGHQITIAQAETVNDLERHAALHALALAALADSEDLRWDLERLAARGAELDDEAKLREEYAARGLPVIDIPAKGWDYNRGPCPIGYNADEDSAVGYYPGNPAGERHWDTRPVLLVTRVTTDAPATKSKEQVEREAQWAKDEADRKEALEQAALASRLRTEHVIGLTAHLKVPEPLSVHLQSFVARLVAGFTAGDIEQLIVACGVDLTRVKNDYSNVGIAHQILDLSTKDLLAVFGAAIAIGSAEHRHHSWGEHQVTAMHNGRAYWEAFATSGYDFPQIDLDERTTLEEKIAQAEEASTQAEPS